ncbi:type III secretion system inner rod subunit SctI [Salmonella enterica]|nr:EscI/YscI/HrpB family type III secretion system inner rod protein [Salmonella enterica subsp. enterica serovar Sandiego]EEC0251388.1 EscI/YscI/HrpB family type III secretion system inner rod protein [Salmonella enterica subsp. enterica]EJW2128700.1 type III secretion system inner rod subunit SctI [Salmonella enterica]EEE4266583.1 EscI/YscI/HrpB family type III secretion system inner rod protein [Salmonella enterica subsp. enterica serovar Sandiego]EKT1704592.1 type III secretion system inner
MIIDAIHAIGQALAPVTPLGLDNPPEVDLPTQQRFAALLNNPEISDSPHGLMAAQSALTELAVGVDLTAKVAGSLGQTINKLVNLS